MLFLAVALLLPCGSARADAQTGGVLSPAAAACQKRIANAGRTFKATKLRAWQTCLDGILSGTGCDAATRDATIAAAEATFVGKVAALCTAPLLFDPPPNGLGFAHSCDLEPGPLEPAEQQCRILPANDPPSLTRCLICWKQAETHELLKILYPCLATQVPEGSALDCGTPPTVCPSKPRQVTCTKRIAEAGITFLLAREKALEACLNRVAVGASTGPCPDSRAAAAISAAENVKIATIQQYCARRPKGWWRVCPEEPDLATCTQTIGSVADIINCVDQSAELTSDELICQENPSASANGIACPAPEPYCGDGIVNQTGEQCDDGNTIGGDGCSATCQREPGFVCQGSPSVCTTVCGDGIRAAAEQCDDGNTASGDGCSATCQTESEYCGDGILQPALGEACDDGNHVDGDGCNANCQLPITVAVSGVFSVLNTHTGDPAPVLNAAVGPTFSVVNTHVFDPAALLNTAVGPTFSVLNTTVFDPAPLLKTAVGPTFSTLNTTVFDPAPLLNTAVGPTFSALNTFVVDPAALLTTAAGPTFSTLNTTVLDPAPLLNTAVGPTVSVLNASVFDPGVLITTTAGPTFSVLNASVFDPGPLLRTAAGPAFSVLNSHVSDPAPLLTWTAGATFSVLNTYQ